MNNATNTLVTDFCFAMVKHDGLAMHGDDLIFERLKAKGFVICAQKLVKLDEAQIDTIYCIIADKPFYGRMKTSIISKDALCLIVGGGKDLVETIEALKGSPTTPGTIRGDLSYIHQMKPEQYQAFQKDESITNAATGRSIHDHIFMDDRFHSSEAGADSRQAIACMFTPEEIIKTAADYPAFSKFMSV